MTFDPLKLAWTRNGKPVRILCDDLKRDDRRTVLAAIDMGGWEDVVLFYGKGTVQDDGEHPSDLTNEAPAGKEAPKKVESSADDNLFVIAHELSKLSEAQMRADGRIKNIHDRLEVLHDNIADVLGIIRTTKKRNPRK